MLKIGRSWDSLIFNIGVPILVRRDLCIESVPRWQWCVWLMTTVTTDSKITIKTSSNGNIFRVTGEFSAQRPVTRILDVFFDLRPNKRLSIQWWGWWFETPVSTDCPMRTSVSFYLFHIVQPSWNRPKKHPRISWPVNNLYDICFVKKCLIPSKLI